MVFYYLFHGLRNVTLLILFLLLILTQILTLLLPLLLLLLLLPIIIIIKLKIVILIIEIITIIIKVRLIRQLVIRFFWPEAAVQSHSFQVVYVSVKAVVILFQVDICLKKEKTIKEMQSCKRQLTSKTIQFT